MNLRILSIIGYLIMVGSMLALLARESFFGNSPLTIALQIAALFLMIWARVTFGSRSFHLGADATEGGLVTTGPYRWIRHPIYSSLLLAICGSVISHFSITNFLLALLSAAGVALRIFSEERLIVNTYPEYKEYAATRGRIVPFLF